MRKVNVFGKKINQIKTIYVIVFLFAIIFALRTWIISVQTAKLESLQADELILDRQLNQLLETEQEQVIHPIGEIITAFPVEVTMLELETEFLYLKDVSGMSSNTEYSYEIEYDVNNPFDENLPATVRFIEIRFDITTDDVDHLMDFIELMIDLDRIYYIISVDVSLNNGEVISAITVYTFYNQISID
ncbi:MAG: hypothetical protein C4537_04890 [Acholeplasma sp.]|jgi:hypothetical protein|nr:MAG: hypothetical protein C4537_04890 [Acholeplasma sp.]